MDLKFKQVDRQNNPVNRDPNTDWFNNLSQEQLNQIDKFSKDIINLLNKYGMIEHTMNKKIPLLTISPLTLNVIEITLQHYGLFDNEDYCHDCDDEIPLPIVEDLWQLTKPALIDFSICRTSAGNNFMQIQFN